MYDRKAVQEKSCTAFYVRSKNIFSRKLGLLSCNSSEMHKWIVDFVELIWYNITDEIFINYIMFLIVYLVIFSI